MSELGSKLKRAREERGVSINEIATATKISSAALEALERSDYSRLPGGIFSRSFVRAYALAVGLDPDTTVSEFLVELTKSEQEAELLARARQPEISADDREFLERQRRAVRTLRLALLIIIVVALSALAYSGWRWWRSRTPPPPTTSAATAAQWSPPSPPYRRSFGPPFVPSSVSIALCPLPCALPKGGVHSPRICARPSM